MEDILTADKPRYSFQVIPLYKPLKTELRVDACVLARTSGNQYMSGRVHEVKDGQYVIEMLDQEEMKLGSYKINQLHPVFSAWCSKSCTFSFLCLYIARRSYE